MIRFGWQSGSSAVAVLLVLSQNLPAQTGARTSTFPTGASIAGLVRDASGLPQMGALVQVLLPDATAAATALTDPHGRYTLSDLPAGNYEVRATAALFLPAVRSRLHVEQGSRSTVNLTLTTILSPAQWLPATRRTGSEAGDDWVWTLRSSANRPILRMADEQEPNGTAVVFSSSSSSAEHSIPKSQGQVTLVDGDGGFARGGAHDVFLISSGTAEGNATILRADFSGPRTPYPVNPSADLTVGLQRALRAGMISRSVLSYTSHPELTNAGATGLQGAVLRNAQRLQLGDSVTLDAGSVMTDINMGGNIVAMEPFLRIAVRPVGDLQFAYSFTAARGTETLDDLDRLKIATPSVMNVDGKLSLVKGAHQALAASTRLKGRGTLEVAGYRDSMESDTIDGSGLLFAADLGGGRMLSDPTTQSFKVGVGGYTSSGVRIFISEPITSAISVTGQVTSGSALVVDSNEVRELEDTTSSLHAKHTFAALMAVDGKILKTGTTVHSSYRWQPADTLTAVDAFHSGAEGAYLSCILRQPLRVAHILPEGMEAVVDVSNLLAQGYQPFLSKDGRTLFLAESPRVLQAGVSFSF